MRFIADGMLGKLARWLRLAGYDVTYIGDLGTPANEQDDALLKQAKLDRRVLLTCDLLLHRRAKRQGIRSVLVGSSGVVEQLVDVSKRCGRKIEINPKNSRCPMCNGSLEPVDRGDVRGAVPPTVLEAQKEFWRCKDCRKVYWEGKHWKTIVEMASRYSRMVA